jgi:ribosomal-protein-alanine N-acetyltransferase
MEERSSHSELKETGGAPVSFQVSPVSSFWLDRLVEIDSQWNPRAWSEGLFKQELSNSISRVRGLFFDEELVGYLIAHVIWDEAHIVSLGVDKAFRSRGGGRLLLEDFVRMARLEGVRIVTLEVRASNHVAQDLYSSSGFTVAGIRRKYYSNNGEDALTMRREL